MTFRPYFVVEMPLSADGEGPATIGEDAASMTYEIWDVCLNTISSHDLLSDAIRACEKLNGLDELESKLSIAVEALEELCEAIRRGVKEC